MLNGKKENKMYKLAELESKDPKQFWKCLKKKTNQKHAQTPDISPTSWVEYFKLLLNIKPRDHNSHTEYIKHSLKVIETISK